MVRSLFGLLLLGLLAGGWTWFSSESARRLLIRSQEEFKQGLYSNAERLALRAATSPAEASDALLFAANAALKLRRYSVAVDHLSRVMDDGSDNAVAARTLSGDLLLNGLHRLTDAEGQFRRALAQAPSSAEANQHLAYLLGLCGRSWEATACRFTLVRTNAFTATDLLLLALRETALENTDSLSEHARRQPDDPLILLGMALAAQSERRVIEADLLLRRAIASAPELTEARIRLGSLLLETGKLTDFQEWDCQLPPQANEHPETWALRGDAARGQGQLRGAVRCYWEALRRDPCHQRASYQLSQVLIQLELPTQSRPFAQRAVWLQDLLLAMKRNRTSTFSLLAQEAADLCEKLGLYWDAHAWSQLAWKQDPHLEWAQARIKRLGPYLTFDLPRTHPDCDPSRMIDLSSFPLPSSADRLEIKNSSPNDPATSVDQLSFIDDAAVAGLNFTYFNGADPQAGGPRAFEFTGGGVAVNDYDGDGWPDLYFSQGCEWPGSSSRVVHLDRLFRNLGNGRFEDVTESAGVFETSYSQGVTVGDYDCDGFPDLYVANLTSNRLYRNNGDGTFTDATNALGTNPAEWTTSCLMADLNGDALPDIYAVNYLAGDDVFERICRKSDGRPKSCTPYDFRAAQDRFYLNLGDGRFEDRTDDCGFVTPNGKGLGIVAADFHGQGQLSLFVANDTDGNCYFCNHTDRRGDRPGFREQAVVSGLAFDREGRTQACMGVAAGDANGDGRLDLFVTNYFKESNTLYLQQSDDQFVDASRESDLREASMLMLGFGTQFLDGELDGLPDLIVTNGHVDDFRSDGTPYRMRPQYFQNLGRGKFREVTAESLGPFFQGEYLGRSLVKLDWNRDGRPDFAVSHLDSPAALLTNRTRASGHFLAVQLRGVVSSRDAIGTSVRLRVGGQTFVQQLTAGDGYQASNQRQLIFGLGTNDAVDEILIQWPSGLEQRFATPPINTEILAIEGFDQLVQIKKS